MPEFARDEFGRLRNGDASLKSGPSSSFDHDSSLHLVNKSDQRGDDDLYYGPASREHIDRNMCPGQVIQGKVIRIESYGAFVSFRDRLQRYHRGLLHISQLSSQHVKDVMDILRIDQSLYAVVLRVEQDQRIGERIGLSLKDVDQQTGKYSGRDLVNDSITRGVKGGNRRPSQPELLARAKSRRETLLHLDRHWADVESNPSSTQIGMKDHRVTTDKSSSYFRKLWSSSPSHPSKQDDKPSSGNESRREVDSKGSSSDVSSHSSSSNGSIDTSSNESYQLNRRNRRGRLRRGRKENRRRRHSRKRNQSSRSRKRRRRSSSSTSSSCSSSSTSSNESGILKIELDGDVDDDKDEDEGETKVRSDQRDSDLNEAQAFKEAVQGLNEEEEEEGPMPLQQSGAGGAGGADNNASYGKALLPGEGQALAQYVQQNLRIPRRGEIGFSGDDIEQWENSGYVMSGSRHTRMNAVRIRKENQVYSAEEQRALALLTMEENQQKEAQLMEDFRVMLKEKKKLGDK